MKKIEKVCKVCGNKKPLKEFVVHKNYKDKHSDICLICNKEKYQNSFRNKVLDGINEILDQVSEIKKKVDNLTD
jgi:superfamily II helicase